MQLEKRKVHQKKLFKPTLMPSLFHSGQKTKAIQSRHLTKKRDNDKLLKPFKNAA